MAHLVYMSETVTLMFSPQVSCARLLKFNEFMIPFRFKSHLKWSFVPYFFCNKGNIGCIIFIYIAYCFLLASH